MGHSLSHHERVLIKLSGEALKGDLPVGLSPVVLQRIVRDVHELLQTKKQIAIMIGGGNFWRGAEHAEAVDRVSGDSMGMLATIMNGVALKSVFDQHGIPSRILSGLDVPRVCKSFTVRAARASFAVGQVVINVGGMGEPYFTTDTGAVVRALEMGCTLLLKATTVDGVYSADPKKDPKATHFSRISYEEVLRKNLRVMDLPAISLAQDHQLPIQVFAYRGTSNTFLQALEGNIPHTLIATDD